MDMKRDTAVFTAVSLFFDAFIITDYVLSRPIFLYV